MARVRFLLAALVAASLVSFVAAGGGESSGEDECGESAIWTLSDLETKRCCTSVWMINQVDEFEYTAVPTTSGSWGPGSITFWVEEYDHFEDIANPTKVDASKCALDYASSRTCTGAACEDPGSSSNGKCKADVDISAQQYDDICLVAKCTGGTCNDHKVEIKFHHSSDYDDDDNLPPTPGDDKDDRGWSHNSCMSAFMFDDHDARMRCKNVCPKEGRSQCYVGECGALAHRNEERWCTAGGEDYCCAATDDDCCVADDGAVAGLTLGLIFFFTSCGLMCCYVGKCCCFQYRRNTPVTGVMMMYPPGQAPPGVQMQQMGYPQGTHPGQGYVAPAQSQFGAPTYQYTSQAPAAAYPSDGNPYPTATIYTATIDPPGATAPTYPTQPTYPAQQPAAQIQFADGSTFTPEQGQGAGAGAGGGTNYPKV